jgi:hypothetical protein
MSDPYPEREDYDGYAAYEEAVGQWEREHHFSTDGQPVTVGAKFWDNNLRVVQMTEIACHSNAYADTGETQTWHQTGDGQFDTLSGTMQPYGRLARRFEGKDAENYAPGTNYRDVK